MPGDLYGTCVPRMDLSVYQTRRARASPGLPSRAAHEDTAHLSRFEITRVKVASRMVGVTPQLPPCCIAAGCSPATERILRYSLCSLSRTSFFELSSVFNFFKHVKIREFS